LSVNKGQAMERIADRLREARRNAGHASAEEFAERIGIAPEAYRAYEDGTRYMSPQLGYRIAQVLGVGWVDLLYGPEYTDEDADYGWQGMSSRRRPVHVSGAPVFKPAPQPPREMVAHVGGEVAVMERPADEFSTPLQSLLARAQNRTEPGLALQPVSEPDAEPPMARPASPRARRAPAAETLTFDELDAQLAAGAGLQRASQHPLGSWSVPREILRAASRNAGAALKMLTVLGDEMDPTFRINDRILVDTADTRPSPAGVFMVWDGISLVLRRIEITAGSEPVRLRISTDSPRYQPVERLHAETLIQGRVIARWSWV
jgi:DNA-binding XRE family transcriptional regulator